MFRVQREGNEASQHEVSNRGEYEVSLDPARLESEITSLFAGLAWVERSHLSSPLEVCRLSFACDPLVYFLKIAVK